MLDFQFLFRWIALFGCLLFSQGALLAQESVDTVYTMADTVVARQLLEEVKDLIGKRKLDEAMEKAMTAERIYRQTVGEESREMGDVWHQMGLIGAYQGNLDKAIDYFQKALEIRLKIFGQEHLDVAKLYNSLGAAFQEKGENENAAELHQKALEIRLKLLGEEHPDVAVSYYNLGLSFNHKGEYDKAIWSNQKALNIRLKTLSVENPNVANSYNNLGAAFEKKGEYNEALKCHENALELRLIALGTEHHYVALSYGNLGNLYNYKGDYDKAIEYFQKSLEIFTRNLSPEHLYVASTYHNLGTSYLGKENYNRAIEYCQKALEIRLKIFGPEHSEIASTYNNLSQLFRHKREYGKALNYSKEAYIIRIKSLGAEHPSIVSSYVSLANSYYYLNDYEKAIELLKKALELGLKTTGNEHPNIAVIYNSLGVYFHDKGEYIEAIDCFREVLRIRIKILGLENPEVASTYSNMAKTYYLNRDYSKAIELHKDALNACRYTPVDFSKANSLNVIIESLNALSHTLQTQYHQYLTPDLLTQSHDYALQAIAAIDFQQSSFSEESTKAFWQGKNYPIYEQAIGISLLKANVDKDAALRHNAFTYAEKSKAGQLQAQFQGADAAKVAEVPDSLLQQEHDLRIDIAWREKQRQSLLDKGLAETDTSVLRISGIVFDLKQKATSLVELLKEQYPDYHDLKYNLSTITVEEVQRELLRPQEALLEYFVGDSSIFIFLIKQDDYQVVEVKKDFPLEAWVDTLRNNIYKNKSTGARDYAQAAADLYDKLVRPVEGLLPERLIIIPDGVLGYVPFDALLTERPKDPNKYAKHKYLLEKHQISYCYSATLLKKMRERQHRHAPEKEFTAFAPYYTGNVDELAVIQPLQFSADSLYASLRSYTPNFLPINATGTEVRSISALTGGDVFYGSEATEARFDSIAGQYRIVHLATHGIADNRVGDYSFLAFHILPDSTENELLYVRDLYNLELNADMVVLSACETGLGELQRGEGIISLARAFAYAGAKSIVNTLWTVDDTSTGALMIEFYSYLKQGKEKDEALRLAKLAFLKKYPRRALPFYWAGVIPVGDMRKLW